MKKKDLSGRRCGFFHFLFIYNDFLFQMNFFLSTPSYLRLCHCCHTDYLHDHSIRMFSSSRAYIGTSFYTWTFAPVTPFLQIPFHIKASCITSAPYNTMLHPKFPSRILHCRVAPQQLPLPYPISHAPNTQYLAQDLIAPGVSSLWGTHVMYS